MSATSGNIWYINWSDKTNVKIVKGHGDKVRKSWGQLCAY